jgi:hypothetical protein
MKVILVSVGNFQDYLITNIQNLVSHGNNDITVITEKKFFNKIENNKNFITSNIELIDSIDLDDLCYRQCSNLDRNFRNGFWYLCSLRLFYVYSYIKKYNVTNCIHIENDVLTYENFDNLKDKFIHNKLYATFDCHNRVIVGLIYIPSAEAFKPVIENYDSNLNDMENLSKFDETVIIPLPIIDNCTVYNKLSKYYNEFDCIFDAAAIGQYLGGIDKQNDSNDTRGFINETCLVKYNNYEFIWKNENGLYNPYLKTGDKFIKIINLHIHCKELFKFMSNYPLENKYINISI